MAVWVVRAGKHGEREALALEQGIATMGWEGLGDLSQAATREAVERQHAQDFPGISRASLGNWTGQTWAFRGRMAEGDLVVMPLKTRSAVAIGQVAGPYQYRPDGPEDAKHTRPVRWLRTDLPRNAFDQDLLYSMGGQLAIYQISRNQAEERIRAAVEGKAPPPPTPKPVGVEPTLGEVEAPLNLEEVAQDQIRAHLGQKYKGHELARLVTALLTAQGYKTVMSPPGADGGVDIIAGQGPLGFDPPRLCVQVKSGDQPLDVGPLRELQGVLKRFGAHQGLLVSWGGFKSSVLREARQLFFEVRLWDAGDVVAALLEHYDRLPADLRAELPLKRIWALVPEE
jgi:restriction system protein